MAESESSDTYKENIYYIVEKKCTRYCHKLRSFCHIISKKCPRTEISANIYIPVI